MKLFDIAAWVELISGFDIRYLSSSTLHIATGCLFVFTFGDSFFSFASVCLFFGVIHVEVDFLNKQLANNKAED